MATEPLSPTLGALLRQTAARVPDRPALLSDERSLSWAELDAEVDAVAALLQRVGVQPGEAVGFMIAKRPEVVVGFLACARIGALYAPINFKLHADMVRDQLRTARIRTVFTELSREDLLRQLIPELPDPRRIVYVGTRGAYGETAYDDAKPARPEPFVEAPGTACYYNYTSGTTGRPKGAITTHAQILANAVDTIDGLGFVEDDVFLGMFSVFAHPHELFHRSLVLGGSFVILDTMSPRIISQSVERFGVSWMMAVPSFYEMMLDHAAAPTRRGGHDLSSLRILESGGAWVGAGPLARMEEAFSGTFLPVWGCTEATGVALANGLMGSEGRRRKPGATGLPVPGYEVQVVDDHGRERPRGEVGELIIRGPSVVEGYIHNPDETAALFRNGWYHTQDLVTQDAEGFVHFVGRRSEMLKIGGIRVYPLEIERIIKDHPDVRDVVVVRAEERVRGEIARAVVTLVDGSDLDVRRVQQYCRARMAVYKVPRIVEFWTEIPKLPNGKIDKRAVRDVAPDPGRDER